jgi:hypothetical protein
MVPLLWRCCPGDAWVFVPGFGWTPAAVAQCCAAALTAVMCGMWQMRIRENSESIAFYGGEQNEKRVLLDRFRQAIDNLSELVRAHSGDILLCAGSNPRRVSPTRRSSGGLAVTTTLCSSKCVEIFHSRDLKRR